MTYTHITKFASTSNKLVDIHTLRTEVGTGPQGRKWVQGLEDGSKYLVVEGRTWPLGKLKGE